MFRFLPFLCNFSSVFSNSLTGNPKHITLTWTLILSSYILKWYIFRVSSQFSISVMSYNYSIIKNALHLPTWICIFVWSLNKFKNFHGVENTFTWFKIAMHVLLEKKWIIFGWFAENSENSWIFSSVQLVFKIVEFFFSTWSNVIIINKNIIWKPIGIQRQIEKEMKRNKGSLLPFSLLFNINTSSISVNEQLKPYKHSTVDLFYRFICCLMMIATIFYYENSKITLIYCYSHITLQTLNGISFFFFFFRCCCCCFSFLNNYV